MPEHPLPAARLATEDVSVVTLLLNLSQQIARVEGAQVILVGQMQSADLSRREIHKKLDAVNEKASDAANRAEIAVTEAKQAVSAAAGMKPSVDDYVTMRGYVRVGLWALGLIIMPTIGLLGYAAVSLWHFVVAHVDLSRLWKS